MQQRALPTHSAKIDRTSRSTSSDTFNIRSLTAILVLLCSATSDKPVKQDMNALLDTYIKIADDEEAKHAAPPENDHKKSKNKHKKVNC